jgi:outer membrane protein assembly factor BamB
MMHLLSFLVLLSLILSFSAAGSAPSQTQFSQWEGWGGDYYNDHWASWNKEISSYINSIKQYCKIQYETGVSAAPAMSGNIAYYPTWNGSFVAFDISTCKTVWSINVTAIIWDFGPLTADQVAITAAVARTSPQIDFKNNIVYFATLTHALVVAVNSKTGKVLGLKQISTHPFAMITMSPTFYNGKLLIGVSSKEEGAAGTIAGYTCCSFIGHFLALSFSIRAGKFSVLWDIPMIPPSQAAQNWSGGAIWGSQPSIDPRRNLVFIATGNTYSVPDAILACQNATANSTAEPTGHDPCLPPDIWQNSILAISITSGLVSWVRQIPALDAWTVACNSVAGSPNCPQTPGPDADFGMAPSFVPGSPRTPHGKDVLVVGQKNGILYAIEAATGKILWSVLTNPGGFAGGLSYGLAVDDRRVYFTAINLQMETWEVLPQNETINYSAWGAVALKDGAFLWGTPVPLNGTAFGPAMVVGDLVLVGRQNSGGLGGTTTGSFYALEKETGRVLGSVDVEAVFWGGVAVQGRSILFGVGYGNFVPPGNGSFNVFRV